MRNRVEDLQPAQSAPVADVQPTKQADQPTYHWERLHAPCRRYKRGLYNATFTEQRETYLVHIDGSYRSDVGRDNIVVEEIFEEYHPYIAIGRAVIKFLESRMGTRIHSLEIYIRTLDVKRTRKRKQ